mmetsp:Transcript_42480/g.104125  ORF Transcript_42480/g.104125 Transcript_42480/m.104125 type:complete len:232 (+) Transcript_42480:576-1271(+)
MGLVDQRPPRARVNDVPPEMVWPETKEAVVAHVLLAVGARERRDGQREVLVSPRAALLDLLLSPVCVPPSRYREAAKRARVVEERPVKLAQRQVPHVLLQRSDARLLLRGEVRDARGGREGPLPPELCKHAVPCPALSHDRGIVPRLQRRHPASSQPERPGPALRWQGELEREDQEEEDGSGLLLYCSQAAKKACSRSSCEPPFPDLSPALLSPPKGTAPERPGSSNGSQR